MIFIIVNEQIKNTYKMIIFFVIICIKFKFIHLKLFLHSKNIIKFLFIKNRNYILNYQTNIC